MAGMSPEAYDPRMGYDPSRKLTDGDVQALKPPGWWGDEGKLFRDFTFGTYREGVEFALAVAGLAERQNHHPDLHLLYRRVRVTYFTHDAGGVTRLDLEGARAVNALWEETRDGEDA